MFGIEFCPQTRKVITKMADPIVDSGAATVGTNEAELQLKGHYPRADWTLVLTPRDGHVQTF